MRKINPRIIGVVTIIFTLLLTGIFVTEVISDPAEPTWQPCPDDDTGG